MNVHVFQDHRPITNADNDGKDRDGLDTGKVRKAYKRLYDTFGIEASPSTGPDAV